MALTVVVLTAAPEGLRGHLTRWLVEVSAGVFVGDLNRRVRDRAWTTIASRVGDGAALMVEHSDNEQGWAVRSTGRDRWTPVDFDGLILMARPRQ